MSQFYDQASLVMVPSGYKAGKVYSQKPLSTDGELTFTRNSNATRVNADGLVEKVRTNLQPASNEFSNLGYTKAQVTISADSVTGPFGTDSADLMTVSASSAEHNIYYASIAVTANVPYTLSFYAKKGTGRYIASWIYYSTSLGGPYATFDLDTNTIVSSGLAGGAGTTYLGSSIETIGNGWVRISVSALSPTDTYIITAIDTRASGSLVPQVPYTGAGETFYIYGLQLEASDFGPTDYIATNAAVSVGPTANVPRLNYSNGCPSLLLEPQRTNLFTFSEAFDNGAWIGGGAGKPTITPNFGISPDGYQNADKITATGSDYQLNQFLAQATTTYTISCWMRTNTGTTNINMYVNNGQEGSLECAVTSEWQRFTYTSTTTTVSGGGRCGFFNREALNDSKYVLIWGAQVEAGSYATSYIPTGGSGASVTRLADLCNKSAAFTTSANWTIFAEFDYINAEKILDATFTSSTGRFVGFYNWYGTFRVIFNTGGGANAGRVIKDTNGKVKVVLQNDGTDCYVFLNGVKLGGADTAGAMPITGTLASISYSFYAGTAYDTAKELEQFLIFNQKLTDAQCIELSTL